MNAGVALVQAYLHLNGYFTVPEFPVIAGLRSGRYEEVTDVDLLAVRLPLAAHVVSRGRPGPEDDLRLETDAALAPTGAAVDALIAEVKEGRARLNDAARTPAVLAAALTRIGCVVPARLDHAVERLVADGRVDLPAAEGGGVPTRVRLVAFGEGETGRADGYEVVSIRDVARHVDRHLERYHSVLHPADLSDPVLGLLHLLKKTSR